jgi:signal transduction histidine kinase
LKETVTQFVRAQLPLAWVVAQIFWWCLAESAVFAQPTNLVLTTAAEVLALPAERAEQGIPIVVKGVVTVAEEYWNRKFFIQDASGGVFVDHAGQQQPIPGDLVEVSGISQAGGFAPCIGKSSWRRLGAAPLPEARRVSIERLMSGVEDGQRIEVTGIVRAVGVENELLAVDLMSGGFRLRVFAKIPPGLGDLQTLVGNRVRVRGTDAVSYNGRLRQMTTLRVFAPLLEDFVVEEAELSAPFKEPTVPLNSIAQYRNEHVPGKRVHVKGTVTFQRPGEDLFLQDATGGMQVKSRLLEKVAPGAVVEAVGFPNFEQFLPVLQDAVFRRTDAPRQTPTTKAVTIPELEGGFRHADLITIQGRVLDRTERWISNPEGAQSGQRTILTLQSSNFLFSVEGSATGAGAEKMSVPIGSLLEVSGVCLMKITEDGKLQSLLVLLPDPKNIRILQAPGWWTPERLLIGLASLFIVLVVALGWSVMVSRRNAALKISICEKEQAQIGLQHATEHLEERVKERSEQLKLQITARQEAELQFKAVLTERTRLAQELHDTLEQTLTGIALQMDTASEFAQSEKERANHHLELARNLVTQSQTEVRCSVWDLRSRSSEQIDLAGLLLKISKQLTDDTSIEVQINAVGRVRPLSELIEDNLLRVAQEALTNIIKHSQATQATITLDYGPQHVILTIRDNGVGFVADQQAGAREGHFGLLGISERTTRLGGKASIRSEPREGTTVQVTIPIQLPADARLIGSQLAKPS